MNGPEAGTPAADEEASQLHALRLALADERFVLFTQAIVELENEAVVQHELLIRMVAEDGRLIAPDAFLPIAERHGLIAQIDRWVLRQALGYAARGHAVQMNISGGTLGDPDIGDCVERELAEAGAHPALVAFEITETALVDNEEIAAAFIDRVRSLGCRCALDDFGSGYGGFSYLKRFSVDCLKIDREFVGDLLTDTGSEEVVRAIVQLARGFGLMTVAEGVEDALTVERLWSLGVEHAQGYHFARPSAASEVLRGSAVLPVLSSSSPRLRRVSNMRTDGLARRFGNALRVGEASAAERVVEDALTSGLAPEAVQTLVIAPAMGTIGELWEARAIGVADEHLATSISHGALARLSREMNARGARLRSREPVLLAAVEGEHHVLGLRMIADVLEGAGFDVLYLGEDVPVDSLQAFLVRHRPAVAGLTFGTANPICHLADSLWAIHEFCPDTRVMLGGRAVPPRLREADYPYVANSMEVVRVIEVLLAGPPQRLPAIVDLVRSDWTRSQASREHVAGGKP